MGKVEFYTMTRPSGLLALLAQRVFGASEIIASTLSRASAA